MTVKCLGCANLDLQTFKNHAAQGAGRCPRDPVGVFVNIKADRECKSFKPGDVDLVDKRIAWAEKL